MKKNDCYEVSITGMSSEGNGVCRVDNFAVFIPDTAIGDVALVKIVKVLKSYAFGRLEKLITPSNSRVEPDCSCYTQCGGCTYRHINYQAELAIKQDYVEQSFSRIGGINIPCQTIIGSGRDMQYRNKAQYPVSINSSGEIVCGFYAKRSHRVINCTDCMLQSDEFEQIKSAIIDFIKINNIDPYDEITQNGTVRHIYIRKAEFTNEVMVCIVVKNTMPLKNEFVRMVTERFDNIKSIVININNKNTNVILGEKCLVIYGEDYITDVICGVKIKISALAFYQVNKLQAEVLYNKAIELARLKKDDILIDLYCGTGTIGLIAANNVSKVIGIEIIPQAIENAKQNALLNGISNIDFICNDATKASKQLLSDNVNPHVVIVDPPRKGLDPEVIDSIVAMSPERLVMISCNPSTCARDTKLLLENGYKVKTIIPVDMFPRTTHVECICLLEKNK